MNDWLTIAYIVVTAFLVWQNFRQKKALHQLQEELFHLKKETYIAFAKTQQHLEKIQALKAIRQKFNELSLLYALKVYELANKPHQVDEQFK